MAPCAGLQITSGPASPIPVPVPNEFLAHGTGTLDKCEVYDTLAALHGRPPLRGRNVRWVMDIGLG